MLPFMKDARKESPRAVVEESPLKMRKTEKDAIWQWTGGEREREGAHSSGSQITRPAVIQVPDDTEEPSPKRLRSIQETHPGRDSSLAEELLQSELNVDSEEETYEHVGKDEPPDVTEEELAKLDDEATKHEEELLMMQMGVLERLNPDDPDEPGSYTLTTKMVVTWKNREEKGGWFRRAGLVARQYKWSVFTDDAFAPTSASVIVRLMLQFMLMTGLSLYVLDVKDAFLLTDQPEDEKAIVMTPHDKYRLRRNLPGQRNAAAQWPHGFCRAAKEYGLVMDKMQPTFMKKETNIVGKRLLLTIHVDDLMVIGDPEEVTSFIKFLEGKKWKLEKKGPIRHGVFEYLKRQMEVTENGITVRADSEHIKELAKLTHVEKLKPRSTPTDHNFTKLSKDDEPMEESEVTRFRSAVGKLLYIAPDRPDIQFVSQGLAALMRRPRKAGWK